MNSSINPYQPPVATTAVNGDSACLRFDGVITQEDYRRLLPGGDVERWLFVLLAILLSIVIVFMGMATFYVMMNAGNFVPGLVMLALCCSFGVGLWFCKTRISAQDIVERRLARHADLLGPAKGELSRSGMTLYDGIHWYWFGPSRLTKSVVMPQGIRIRLDRNPERFLALTTDQIDGYVESVARGLREHWEESRFSAGDDQVPAPESWVNATTPSDDAIGFRGEVVVETSHRTLPRLRAAASGLAVGAVLTGASLFLFLRDTSQSLSLLLVAYSVVCLTLNLRSWWDYFRGKTTQSWFQHGWVSSQEIVMNDGQSGVRMPLIELASWQMMDQLQLLTLKKGGIYYLPRELFAGDDQWTRLCEIGRRQQLRPGPHPNTTTPPFNPSSVVRASRSDA